MSCNIFSKFIILRIWTLSFSLKNINNNSSSNTDGALTEQHITKMTSIITKEMVANFYISFFNSRVPEFPDIGPLLNFGDVKLHLVARFHGLAEFRFVDGHEIDQLARRRPPLGSRGKITARRLCGQASGSDFSHRCGDATARADLGDESAYRRRE